MTVGLSAFTVLDEFHHAYKSYTKQQHVADPRALSYLKVRWNEALRIADAKTYLYSFGKVGQDRAKRPLDTPSSDPESLIATAEKLLDDGHLAEATICLHRIAETFELIGLNKAVENAETDGLDTARGPDEATLVNKISPEVSLLHEKCDRITALVQFFSGSPILVDNSEDDWIPTPMPIQGKELSFARQQVFHILGLICRVNLSLEQGLRPLYQAVQIVGVSEQAGSICDVAISKDNQRDLHWQETKLYANLVLTSLSCYCFVLSQLIVDFKGSDLKFRLEEMNLNHPKRKALERRKVTKHAMCLLESFSQLCQIDPKRTASNWPQIQSALFATCIVELTQHTYTQLELKHLRHSMMQFCVDLRKIGRDDVAKAIQYNPQSQSFRSLRHHLNQNRLTAHTKSSQLRQLPDIKQIPGAVFSDVVRNSAMQNPLLAACEPESQSTAMVAYRDVTAQMMNRSSKAPYMWHTVIPHMSLQYRCVKYAMLASAASSKALLLPPGELEQKQKLDQQQVIKWTNRAIHDALAKPVPTEAILLMSLLLSCTDFLNGEPDHAILHIKHGFRIAEAKGSPYDPKDGILAYCRTFMDSIQQTQEFKSGGSDANDRHRRLAQALASFHLTLHFFERLIVRVRMADLLEKRKICDVLMLARQELIWLRSRWDSKLRTECGDGLAQTLILSEFADTKRLIMPWFTALQPLHRALSRGETLDVVKFEIAMERTLPFFTLAQAGSDRDLREDSAEMMMRGPVLRGKSI